MVKYFNLIFGTVIEDQLLGKYSINIGKIFSLWCKKVVLKFFNFYSFILNKDTIISKCSLKLDDFKNIYFSMHIFNIFPFKRRFLTRITKKLINFLLKKISNSGGCINFYIPFKLRLNIAIKFHAYCLIGLKTLHVSTKNAANYDMSIITTG